MTLEITVACSFATEPPTVDQLTARMRVFIRKINSSGACEPLSPRCVQVQAASGKTIRFRMLYRRSVRCQEESRRLLVGIIHQSFHDSNILEIFMSAKSDAFVPSISPRIAAALFDSADS